MTDPARGARGRLRERLLRACDEWDGEGSMPRAATRSLIHQLYELLAETEPAGTAEIDGAVEETIGRLEVFVDREGEVVRDAWRTILREFARRVRSVR